jgi:predicted GNAT family acetyltransferase
MMDGVNALVQDNPAKRRFEILVEGTLAGFAAYEVRDGVIVFTHTKVFDEFEGQGVGGWLAREALDQLRARGDKVVARCPFISEWIEKHPQYADLLVDAS